MADYIDREAVLDYIRYKVCQGEGNIEHRCNRGSCAYCGICEIMCDISSMPAAAVQPIRRGQWILKSEKIVDVEVKLPTECSICGFSEFKAEKYNYCPNCGRDMMTE